MRMVEVQYNPYIPKMSILIDGSPPSDFSRLVQYTEEDLWFWSDRILDTIYRELSDGFSIIFTGTDEDAAVMRSICEQDQHCLRFAANRFVITDPLQSRMQRLNQLIKKDGRFNYRKTEIEAAFILNSRKSGLYDLIRAIDIRNLYCHVDVSAVQAHVGFDERKTDVIFYITDNAADTEWIRQISCPVFVILMGEKNKLLKVGRMVRFWETTEEGLLETIFSCFLQGPLLWAFRDCLNSMREAMEGEEEILALANVEPAIHILVEKEIEVGKSVRIRVSTKHEEVPLPRLIYRIPEEDVAFSDGLCVFGKKEGDATLEVYRYGEKAPFAVEKIKVIRRNRIRKILLSEDTLLLGIGERKKLECSYFPEDADNPDTISWVSSNEDIVRTNRNGEMTAVGCGNCQIMCIAENISAKCICQVKPYLQEIRIMTPLENDRLYLEPFEEKNLQLCCVPEDCKDGSLRIISLDTDVVNVIGNTLYAKSGGRTSLTIQNISGSKSRTLGVVVRTVPTERRGILNSFLQRLKGN